jgi:hypothetical protein
VNVEACFLLRVLLRVPTGITRGFPQRHDDV